MKQEYRMSGPNLLCAKNGGLFRVPCDNMELGLAYIFCTSTCPYFDYQKDPSTGEESTIRRCHKRTIKLKEVTE